MSHESAIIRAFRDKEILVALNLAYSDRIRLSLTCKDAFKALIPGIWFYQPGLLKLLKCLPADAWSNPMINTKTKIRKYHIHSPERLDWTRVDEYAKHIDDLCVSNHAEVSDVSMALVAHHYHPSLRPLLPRLRYLELFESSESSSPYPQLFFSPALQELLIETTVNGMIGFDPELMASRLELAAPLSRNIKEVILNGGSIAYSDFHMQSDRMEDALRMFLRSALNLEVFEVDNQIYLPTSCVELLAALPRLTRLQLPMPEDQMEALGLLARYARVSHKTPWFQALKHLTLAVYKLDGDSQAFLDSLHDVPLQSFAIAPCYQPDETTLVQHLEALTGGESKDTLRCIELLLTRVYCEDPQLVAHLRAEDVLRPLLALKDLRALYLYAFKLDVPRELFQTIAATWPELRALVMCRPFDSRTAKHTPVDFGTEFGPEDIAPLLRGCEALHLLGVNLAKGYFPELAPSGDFVRYQSRCFLHRYGEVSLERRLEEIEETRAREREAKEAEARNAEAQEAEAQEAEAQEAEAQEAEAQEAGAQAEAVAQVDEAL
ncbi:hypothetical protein BD413DRAFT_609930 [Trametes elegans]|nr:hypothetical protein BD413DRAFT_609930 [Trametes elegans]